MTQAKRKPAVSRSVRRLMARLPVAATEFDYSSEEPGPGQLSMCERAVAVEALRWALRQAATDATYEALRDRIREAIRELRERAK